MRSIVEQGVGLTGLDPNWTGVETRLMPRPIMEQGVGWVGHQALAGWGRVHGKTGTGPGSRE